MGSSIRSITVRKEVDIENISPDTETNNYIAGVDLYAWIYQFLNKIRDHETGEPLKDSEGRITSHLQGLFYRTMNLRECGIEPLFIAEGGYPDLKEEEIQKRSESREKAQREWEVAKLMGEDERAKSLEIKRRRVSDEMQESAISLVQAMGCPSIVPPEEGEAQASYMCRNGDIDYVISQDYDTLLYQSPNLLQNLTSSTTEVIYLEDCLEENDLTSKELIWFGILQGTDYNTSPNGVGPKRGLSIVNNSSSIQEVIDNARDWDNSIDSERWRETYNLYLQPNVDKEISVDSTDWKSPDEDGIVELLVERHGFRKDKVKNNITNVQYTINQEGFGSF